MSEEPSRLEILQTLQSAAFNRWEKRRDYEWKLSYAIWAALAGFIATVVVGKDSNFQVRLSDLVLVAGGFLAILGVHAWYLTFMVANTLRDLDAQSDIELAIRKLDPWIVDKLSDRFLGAGMSRQGWFVRRYGLWAQLGITAALCMAAYWFCVLGTRSIDTGKTRPKATLTSAVDCACGISGQNKGSKETVISHSSNATP